MSNQSRTFLQFASSESDADILYGSGFAAYDPFLYLEHDGRSYLVVSDFECSRASRESNADFVWPASVLAREEACRRGLAVPDGSHPVLAVAALRRLKVRRLSVPGQFPVGMVKLLERDGFRVTVNQAPTYPARLIKSAREIRAITRVQRVVENALAAAARLLRQSRIRGGRLIHAGRSLGAEDLHRAINVKLVEGGCAASQSIVAPGDQAVDPHNVGSGPIRSGEPVVIDIFPRSMNSHYFADMTRTLVRGRPSPALVRQYRAVLKSQKLALSMIRPGVAVRKVHRAVQRCLEREGFPTGEKDGRLQGFTHSTGHGLGLDIHEPPRIGLVPSSIRFRAGMVVTVEPGLYYLGTGGVRIEDMVVVTRKGIRNLTRYPKRLSVCY